jgi:hypothetical protein
MLNVAKIKAEGFITIQDVDKDNNVLSTVFETHNDIHFENLSYAIVKSLGNKPTGPINWLYLGNGGSVVNALGEVSYQTPNVDGQGADLYNTTYYKIVDNLNTSNTDTDNNFMTVSHTTGNLYSDLTVTCTLDYGEPVGQNLTDTTSTTEGSYTFDEIGLKDYDGNLLTHAIFAPLTKALNRRFKFIYKIRIQFV